MRSSRYARLHDKKASLVNNIDSLYGLKESKRPRKQPRVRSAVILDLELPWVASSNWPRPRVPLAPVVEEKVPDVVAVLDSNILAVLPTGGDEPEGKSRGKYQTWIHGNYLPLINASVVGCKIHMEGGEASSRQWEGGRWHRGFCKAEL